MIYPICLANPEVQVKTASFLDFLSSRSQSKRVSISKLEMWPFVSRVRFFGREVDILWSCLRILFHPEDPR